MMMSSSLAVLLLVGVQATWLSQKVTPVEKVISLLTKMESEIAAEGKEEAASYDKFACFCKEQADDKLYAITKSEKLIERQTAQIKMLVGEIEVLNAAISDLKEQKKKLEDEQDAAQKVRAKEHELYAEEEADLAGAIAAMKGAIKALKDSKEQMSDAKLQLIRTKVSSSLSASAKQLAAVRVFMEMLEPGKPAAYEYRSNDIIATLEGLLKTFKGNKIELDETEANTRHDYDMAAQARGNSIKFAQEDIDLKEKLSADKSKEQSRIEKERDEETADKESDEAFMKELTEQGETKAKDFDQRSQSRSAELTAISEAIGILKSAVQPNFSANKKLNLLTSAPVHGHGHWSWVEDKAIPASGKALSFLQSSRATSAMPRLLDFLDGKASMLQSPLLSTLAMKIKMGLGKDHFVKVRSIINDLIAKLEADAESEASQKAFCDEEMGKATSARDEATGKIEGSTADIDQAESEIAQLTEEIDELSKQVAELRKGLFEATELRNKEKAENEKTIEEAEAGGEAVKKAIEVLKNFYSPELLQAQFVPAGADRDGNTVADLAPATASGEYNGKQDSAKGVFGLLEVIQSDFERTVTTTTEGEAEAQETFETYESDTKADIEQKNDTKKEKEQLRETTEADLTGYQEDLKTAKENLADAKEELTKLKPMCVDSGATWEERRARGKQEVEALKQALAILEDWQK